MSALDKLKSIFFVTEETEQKEQPAQTPANQGVKTESKPSPQPSGKVGASTRGLDDKIFESLSKAIEANNMAGFDFFEYKTSIKALENLPMDEATKYRSAFATASTMGVNLEKLVQSADYYKDVLNKEKAKFEEALNLQVDKNVVEKQKLVEGMNADILNKSEQIKKLTEQIQSMQAEIEKHQVFITEANAKIDATKGNFDYTYSLIKSQMEEDVEKMKKYLAAP
jgi:hypothetical protein